MKKEAVDWFVCVFVRRIGEEFVGGIGSTDAKDGDDTRIGIERKVRAPGAIGEAERGVLRRNEAVSFGIDGVGTEAVCQKLSNARDAILFEPGDLLFGERGELDVAEEFIGIMGPSKGGVGKGIRIGEIGFDIEDWGLVKQVMFSDVNF